MYSMCPIFPDVEHFPPRNLCDGIETVAQAERISKKAAAAKLMRAGFSKWIGGTDQEIKNPKKITMMNGRPPTQ